MVPLSIPFLNANKKIDKAIAAVNNGAKPGLQLLIMWIGGREKGCCIGHIFLKTTQIFCILLAIGLEIADVSG